MWHDDPEYIIFQRLYDHEKINFGEQEKKDCVAVATVQV